MTYLYLPANPAAHAVDINCPEVPARVSAVAAALDAPDLRSLPRIMVDHQQQVSKQQICAVHTEAHFQTLAQAVPAEQQVALDRDTTQSHDSFAAARAASWAACDAVERVAREGGNAFCAMRPPGHHATADAAMGFCLLNNVVIAAHHARRVLGISRVAVLDPDVHHGNGTQDLAWDDADFFFASSHQSPAYPGSGAQTERGAHGNIHNAPLPAGTSPQDFLLCWRDRLLPAMVDFAPQCVLISAGFDAHRDDPLGGLCMSDADFYTWTAMMLEAVEMTPAPGVVSALEGGYNLDALAASAAAHVRALAGIEYKTESSHEQNQ